MSAWLDSLKFLPGYASFAWLCGAAIRKNVIRRHRMKIGPADEVREALRTMRRHFKDVVEARRYEPWFAEDGRRDLADRLKELADQVDDPQLHHGLRGIAETWTGVVGYAPSERARVRFTDRAPSPDEVKMGREIDFQLERQSKHAASGLIAVDKVLERLNELERKIIGR